ncbi:acyltransferase family protein [Candidatus Pelagibacter sp. HIMB1509]|uniref:acyltransferase family protein n=1 Tax=Candidatus Pelagibacter sp. HIMB1509 TaxID=3413339 RepID=UPI003F848F14
MKLTYRPEIDGLRAIAVGAVILYHAKITIFGHQPFKGGFIGVDIFFVISGYLITSIILKELITTGKFSFKHFYERRVRRILPALLFVMLVSLPFAWMYLWPSSLIDFSKSILYSLGFSSNFYFHYSGQQYGAESGLLKPFLHTWSLSVEEQYYILFPIVLLITFKFFRKYLIHILILGLVISLGLAEWGSRNHPSLNFYILPTRGWELLAGSILAYFEIIRGHRSKIKTLNLILPVVGLILIGHSILFFNDEMFHPSFYTLSPIIGVCFIIWFSNKNELITKVLSTKLLVGIGIISYSLYLWHYPIFAFARIKDNTPSEYDKFEWIVLSIILSLISYFFVEKSFRNKKNKINKILIVLIFFFSIIFSSTILSIYLDGFKDRKHFPQLIINANKDLDYRKIYQNGKRCHGRTGNDGFCIFGNSINYDANIITLGDSLLDALLGDLILKLKNYNLRLIHTSYPGYLYLPEIERFNKKNKKKKWSKKLHENRKKLMKNLSAEKNYFIIFADYKHILFERRHTFDKDENIINYEVNSVYTGEEYHKLNYEERSVQKLNDFIQTIEEIAVTNKVVLVYPLPQSPDNILKRVNSIFLSKKVIRPEDDPVNYNKIHYLKFNDRIIRAFNNINNKNVLKVKIENDFCSLSKCYFYNNENILLFDKVHTSKYASNIINKKILESINKDLRN